MHIREATESDDRALAELDASSWPIEVQVAAPRPASEPFFDDRRRPSDVIVALIDGSLVGYARLGRHLQVSANDHVWHLHALVVASSARGAGVGAALVDAVIAESRRRGGRKLGLRVLSNNTVAARLYERCGFIEEGRLRSELLRPDGTYADDIWMALWLTPELGS